MISVCPHCNCMTHDIVISTDNVICGKCKLVKSNSDETKNGE